MWISLTFIILNFINLFCPVCVNMLGQIRFMHYVFFGIVAYKFLQCHQMFLITFTCNFQKFTSFWILKVEKSVTGWHSLMASVSVITLRFAEIKVVFSVIVSFLEELSDPAHKKSRLNLLLPFSPIQITTCTHEKGRSVLHFFNQWFYLDYIQVQKPSVKH